MSFTNTLGHTILISKRQTSLMCCDTSLLVWHEGRVNVGFNWKGGQGNSHQDLVPQEKKMMANTSELKFTMEKGSQT